MRLSFLECKGDHGGGFDMAVDPGAGHYGSRAERTLGGMDGGVEFDLRAAVGTIEDARLLLFGTVRIQSAFDGDLADRVA